MLPKTSLNVTHSTSCPNVSPLPKRFYYISCLEITRVLKVLSIRSGMYMIQYNSKFSLILPTHEIPPISCLKNNVAKFKVKYQIRKWILQYHITVFKDHNVLQIRRLWFWPVTGSVNLQTVPKMTSSSSAMSAVLKQAHCQQQAWTRKQPHQLPQKDHPSKKWTVKCQHFHLETHETMNFFQFQNVATPKAIKVS